MSFSGLYRESERSREQRAEGGTDIVKWGRMKIVDCGKTRNEIRYYREPLAKLAYLYILSFPCFHRGAGNYIAMDYRSVCLSFPCSLSVIPAKAGNQGVY